MYSLSGYGEMIRDDSRMAAYVTAMQRSITEDSVVADIGTGVGIFAFIACRLGARKVYAVEPEDIIGVARELAAANGFGDRIEFIQKRSTEVDFSEKADVIVSDLGGVLPMFRTSLSDIVDARERLLAPGGTLIRRTDRLWAAVVESPRLYDKVSRPWLDRPFGVDLGHALQKASNVIVRTSGNDVELLTAPVPWGAIDYHELATVDVRGDIDFMARRAGQGHGLLLWFEGETADGVTYTSGPGGNSVYGNAFLPWEAPVAVSETDRIHVKISADLVHDEYQLSWRSRILDRRGDEKGRFMQSTFQGQAFAAESLRRRSASYTPLRNLEGEIDAYVLQQMDGTRTSGEIANLVLDAYPKQYQSWEEAVARVGELSRRYATGESSKPPVGTFVQFGST